MSNFDRFLVIRREYARIMPEWMDYYEQTGDMRQDPYFMDWKFTPIEADVWSDIRSIGLPFYPQVPALNYFLDFANPFLKIGIECDGKAWHDSDLDRARDARLAAAGWMIFRIEGHECRRQVEPWGEYREDDDDDLVRKYFMQTSTGVIEAIKTKYFDDEPREQYRDWVEWTLFEHRSTPETYPVRKSIRKQTSPVRFSDALDQYFELLMFRARKEAV